MSVNGSSAESRDTESRDTGLDADDSRLIEDPATSTVYLVRHGRTALNASGQLRGLLDPPLDEVGRDEARALAAAIAPSEPILVVSSPLRRAVETAEAIAAECGLTAEIDPALIDRDYGPWAGHRLEDVIAEWGSLDDAPDVEPLADVLERARLVLDDVVQRVGAERAVIVAHDAINRSLIALLDPARWQYPAQVPQRTGCLNVVYHGTDRWLVAKVDVSPLAIAQARLGQ